MTWQSMSMSYVQCRGARCAHGLALATSSSVRQRRLLSVRCDLHMWLWTYITLTLATHNLEYSKLRLTGVHMEVFYVLPAQCCSNVVEEYEPPPHALPVYTNIQSQKDSPRLTRRRSIKISVTHFCLSAGNRSSDL